MKWIVGNKEHVVFCSWEGGVCVVLMWKSYNSGRIRQNFAIIDVFMKG